MKKLLFLLSVISFVSCDKDDKKIEELSIVGKWKEVKGEIVSGKDSKVLLTQTPNSCEAQGYIQFNSDNTFQSKSYYNDGVDCLEDGSDNTTYTYDASTRIVTLYGESTQILDLTSTSFKISEPDEDYNQDGVIDKYVTSYQKI